MRRPSVRRLKQSSSREASCYIPSRRELGHPDPIGKLRQQAPRSFEGESRLADALRPGQRDEPMVGHKADHFLDLTVSADEIRCRCGKVRRSARRTRQVPGRRRFCLLALGCRMRANFAPELVTATHYRPDEVMVRESLAQRLYLGVQIVLPDDPARPDPAHQLVFADDGPVGLDKHDERIESAPAEFNRPAVGENRAALREDRETPELEARRRFGYRIHGRRL